MTRARRALRLARVLLSTQYAYMLEYRAEIALWALSGVLPLVMLGLWRGAGPGAAAGLGNAQLTAYFVAAFVVRQFTIVWVMYAFEEDSLQGRLSPYLLQPLAPVWRYLTAHLAEQATRLPFVLLLVGPLLLLQPAGLQLPQPSELLLGALAMVMAFLVRFVLHFAVTMLCFWSDRATALDRLLLIPYLFLSGLVAPLEVFPPGMRQLALATPFPYFLAFPAQLLSGLDGPGTIPVAAGFAALLAWGALLLPLAWLLWRAGVRRYAAMGA